MKNFISVHDVPDLDVLVQQALTYKNDPYRDRELGLHKRVGCIFLNPSMRTRISTELAARQLGMDVIIFNASSDGWALEFGDGAVMNGNTVEHIRDAAPVFGKYFDILGVRSFPTLKDRDEDYSEFYINQFVKYAGIPVISLESATLHPLQSLADLVTIKEELLTWKDKRKPKIVLTWAPHIKALPQCVANSFAQWMTAWGQADFVVTQPKGYELETSFTKGAAITHNQEEALRDADFVYVKNWSSYQDYGKALSGGKDWMLTLDKLKSSNNARVMHCLPVRRNVELRDDVLDSAQSLVTTQAGNRVWSAQAVISEILKSNG